MNKSTQSLVVVEGQCAGTSVCPLSRVKAGAVVCIKELAASPELRVRLREMGFCEQQRIKLLSRHSNIICQVGNARLGSSRQLAETNLVEALPAQQAASSHVLP